MAVLVAWCWALWKRRTGSALAGGIYLAGFAVTANVLVPAGTIMGERLAYFPSVGACLLAALAWSRLRQWRPRVALGVLAIVVAALGVRTIVRNRDWKNDLTLYSAAVRAVPGSAKMHAYLGLEYMNSGQMELARKELQTALQIKPDFPDALESYGLLEVRLGNDQKGGHLLEQALSMSWRDNPNYDYMAVNLAALLIKTGYTDGALDLLNREISESPGYARAWSNRAVIHFTRGERAAARSDAEAALRLEPTSSQAINVLQLLNLPQHPFLAPKP